MESVQVWLTVFFDDPFWVVVVQRRTANRLEAARVVFGPGPKDYEVYSWLLAHYGELRFSPPIADRDTVPTAANPKRMQREAARRISQTGVGTKAQEALKLQQAEGKQARRQLSRAQKEARAEQLYTLKQAQRKEKHRGR